MSAKLKLAAFQGTCSLGNVEQTLKTMKLQMEIAATAGAELIVFPELFTTGYALKTKPMRELAEPQDGPTFQQLSQWCKKLHIAVLYGYPEVVRTDGTDVCYYISALFIGSDGTSLGNYRKQHLWVVDEPDTFIPGNGDLVIDYNGIRIGVLICYDVEFPEAVRNLALKGVQLVLVPTALPVGVNWCRISKIIVPARANENTVFVAYINHFSTQNDLTFLGHSCIVGPSGEPLVTMGEQECLAITTIDTSVCEDQRKLTHYMRERRPELYGNIVDKNMH